jgi:hypothetical protein
MPNMAQRLTQSSPKASPRTHADATRLTRKDGVYYYRRRLPGPDRTDVAVSLGTRNFREAEHLAEGLDLLYSRTVKTVSDPSELRTILRNFLREVLEDDTTMRLAARPGLPVYTSPDQVNEERDAVDADLEIVE